MSRGFFGGPTGNGGLGSKKRKSEFRVKFDKMMRNYSNKRKKTTQELMRERSGTQVKPYKEMLEDLMDEKMFSPDKATSKYQLPGTAAPETKEMTKGQKAAMELAMQKRAKQRAKKRDLKVDVVPKQFNGKAGGWIDKKGKIRNKFGVIVMEVNLDTGVVTDRMGMKVAKYTPNSMTCEYKLQRLIDRYTREQKQFNPFKMKT